MMTVIVLMGVSGSGKTTIGRLLAESLGWPYFEGDDLHPPENVAKMAQRIPLSDADRAPWLAAVRGLIDACVEARRSAVVSCSALKWSYRQQLQGNRPAVQFVYLQGSFKLISERLSHRQGHYMPVDLLQSQFDALEEPQDALTIRIEQTPQACVQEILQRLELP